jgi:pyrroline-5-carboxylate reductase
MKPKTLGFIGGGRITKIMLAGWRRAGLQPEAICVADKNPEVLSSLKSEFPYIHTTTDDVSKPAACDLVFLGLHPPVIPEILSEIKHTLTPESSFVSLAPKITFSKLSAGLEGYKNLARAIPNAPSIVNAGYNPIAFADELSHERRNEILGLFRPLGECPEVPEETLEAYAILTAMGPTYFWFQLEAIGEVVSSFGLSHQAINEGIDRMITGMLQTFLASGLNPSEVMDLIPVKPLGEHEAVIKECYQQKLSSLYQKLKG